MDLGGNANIRNSREAGASYIRAIPDDERHEIINADKRFTSISGSKWSCGLSVWIALLAQTIRGTIWIWLYIDITFSVPHTFAWKALLTQFGSFCELKSCHNYKEYCSDEIACPGIPILFACLSAVQILILSFILICKRFGSYCLLPLKYVAFLEIVLFFLVTPTVTTVFIQNIGKLNSIMTSQLNVVANTWNTSNLWNITQHSKKCCGINSYIDWDLIDVLYPESCCDTTIGFCLGGDVKSEYVWKNGCFKSEKDTFIFYSVLELILLGFGMLALILQNFCVKYFEKEGNLKKLISKGEEFPNQDLFIQQGSNFISISRNYKTMDLVQLGDVSIKITGTILSTVGIIDSMVSMQICNYSSRDQILLSREVDKLLITVKRDGVLRGCVKISAPDPYKLQSIRVATNSRGTITVQTIEAIYDNI